MSSAQISLAFAAGMLATVNPCGFALLPAYLGFFLGIDANTDDRDASVPQALAIGGAVSLGFVAVFGLLGIVLRSSLSFFQRWLPYVSVAIGIGLLVMGALLLAGKHIAFAAPKLKVGKRQRTFWSMFVYGISYAIASLGCTIGPFVSTVAGAFRRQSFGAGVVVFLAYALRSAGPLALQQVGEQIRVKEFVEKYFYRRYITQGRREPPEDFLPRCRRAVKESVRRND